MRLAFAFYILSFLIFLSILESIFSLIFSLMLNEAVSFPLIEWFFLWVEWIGWLINLSVKLFFLFIATALDPFGYGDDLVLALSELIFHLLEFPVILFYPLVLIFGDIIAELLPDTVGEAIEAAEGTPSVVNLISAIMALGATAVLKMIYPEGHDPLPGSWGRKASGPGGRKTIRIDK